MDDTRRCCLDQHDVAVGRLHDPAGVAAEDRLKPCLTRLRADYEYVIVPRRYQRRQHFLRFTRKHLDAFAAHVKFPHQLRELHGTLDA